MPACKVCGHWFVKVKPQEELCDKCESALYRLSGYVVRVVHGRWVPFHSEVAGYIQYCSACGIGSDAKTDYCPHCGAKMDLMYKGDNNATEHQG